MRIWLVTIGEPWPTDGPNIRLLRTGVIAHQFSSAGDDVTWFNDTFDPISRTHKPAVRRSGFIEPRLRMVALTGGGYRRSVSIARLWHHSRIAADFRRQAAVLERPDIIVASLTPLELSREAVRYGRRTGIPVIVDVRDFWPDIWLDLAPPPLRPAARVVLTPYFRMLTEIVRGSTAICGVSDAAVDWARDRGDSPPATFDGALPLAYSPPEISQPDLEAAERFWDLKGVSGEDGVLTLSFFGTLGPRIEFDTVIEAVTRASPELRARMKVVICGSGEVEQRIAAAARDCSAILAPGWMNTAQIEILKRRTQIGLLPYPSELDFTRSLPNKVFDYLSGGIPILTSLKGTTADLLAREDCGWLYENRSADELLAKIEELVDHPQTVARAAERARVAGAKFRAQDVYADFRKRLDAIVAGCSARHAAPAIVTNPLPNSDGARP